MTEADARDPFEAWLDAYGHHPHDLMHTFTRVDMREAFAAGTRQAAELIGGTEWAAALAAKIGTGPAATSHAAGPSETLQPGG